MKIIVVGCGKVGSALVEELSEEGHDISVVDMDSMALSDITMNYDVMGVAGNGASSEVLKQAGVEHSDLLIAVTDSDELNLLCCLIGRKLGGCKTIARVRNPEYTNEIDIIKGELGLSMTVNPEYAAAEEAARVLLFPSAVQIEPFAKGKVELVIIQVPKDSIIDGLELFKIHQRTNTDVLVCSVERGDDVFIPDGDFVLHAGDVISIVSSSKNTRNFVNRIGLNSKPVRDVMIIGGGKIAFYLSTMLLDLGIDVKILERKRERCEELCDLLPRAVIIHADAANQNILREEGIETADAFVTLTGMDEENLFLSMFAKSCSKAKLITKVDRIDFDQIIKKMDLGTLIHPKDIAADHIISYVRARQNSIGSNVETVYKVIDDKVEALDFLIKEDSPVSGVPISQLKIKKGVLMACVSRQGEIFIPNGRTVIRPGDSVVIVTNNVGFRSIEDILEPSKIN